ncbi:MAG TPA: helix-turn-helix transcriptional regulator [Oculatellaceae cyanobacterium]
MDLNQVLDKAKEITKSDNQTAIRLGIDRQLINGWRKGKSSPNLDHIDELSQLTGIPFETCAYAVGATKEKNAGVVGRFTKKLEKAGIALVLVAMADVNTILTPSPAEAAPALKDQFKAVYIMLSRRLLKAARNLAHAVSRNCQMLPAHAGCLG